MVSPLEDCAVGAKVLVMPKADWKKIDDAVRIEPGDKMRLKKRDTVGEDLFPDKADAEKARAKCAEAINQLQDRLFAERTRTLLVVLQGIDTSGKDGTVRGVFNACGPLGVDVHAFGKPTDIELAHDYLWRIHLALPRLGMIGIFNRSHYEDVLVAKVRGLAPADAVEKRYEQINAFEKHLTENNVAILKFMLHISKDEQRKRLQARVDEPESNWKFNPADLEDRKLWPDYEAAYETALTRCSTPWAPWRVVPADKKWRRNAIIAAIVHGVLEEMAPQYPKPTWRPSDFVIE
jgi:PPK2 family polyphosphate:nucleotide phosphotransferase